MDLLKFKTSNLKPLLDIAIFCAITYGFHELWWWSAPLFKSTEWFQSAGNFMATQVFQSSAWFMQHMLSIDFTVTDHNTFNFHCTPVINPETQLPYPAILRINESCSGLKQFFQITVLFLLFPGPWKHKIWFIPASIIIMHGVNILRIIVLSIVLIHWPQYWDFAHDWILRPFFYVIIFVEWLIWINYFRKPGLKRKPKSSRAV